MGTTVLDTWLTPSEAGKLLDITPARTRQLADEGRLRAERTRFGRLIDPQSVQDRLAAKSAKPAKPSAA